MSFWSSVGNFVRGVAAQVNPFDGGANYSSVQRAARRKKRDEEQQVKQRAPLGTKNGRPIQGPAQKPLKIKSYLRNDPKNLTQIQAPKIKLAQVREQMTQRDKARKLQQLARQFKNGQINQAQRTAAAQAILDTRAKKFNYVKETGRAAGKEVKDMLQSTARGLLQEAPRTIAELIAETSTNVAKGRMKDRYDFSQKKKNTGVSKFLFGEAPAKTFFKQSESMSKSLRKSGNKGLADAVDIGGAAALFALSATDAVPGKKKIIQEGVEAVTESEAKNVLIKVLGDLDDDILEKESKNLAKASTAKEVDTVLKRASKNAINRRKGKGVGSVARTERSPERFSDYGITKVGSKKDFDRAVRTIARKNNETEFDAALRVKNIVENERLLAVEGFKSATPPAPRLEVTGKVAKNPQVKEVLEKLSFGKTSSSAEDNLVAAELENEAKKLGVDFDQGFIDRYQTGRLKSPAEKVMAKILKDTTDQIFLIQKNIDPNIAYRKNYVPQVYEQADDAVVDATQQLQIRTGAANPREFDTYAEASEFGLTPKFKNPAELIGANAASAVRARANKDAVETGLNNGIFDVSPNRGWTPVEGFIDPSGAQIYAQKNVADTINGALQETTTGIGKLFKVGAKVNQTWQNIALAGGIPYTPLNFFTLGQTAKEISAGRVSVAKDLMYSFTPALTKKRFAESSEFVRAMTERGVPFTLPKKGRGFKSIGDAWSEAVDRPTFERFMPNQYLTVAENTFVALKRKGVDDEAALDIAADTVKNYYGITDQILKGRSKITQDAIGTLLFAPRYREGIVNTLFKTGKSIVDPRTYKNPAYAMNRRLAAGIALTAVAYDALNYKLNGRHMWENREGQELSLEIKVGEKDEKGNQPVINIPFMPGFMTIPRAAYGAIKGAVEGDLGKIASEGGKLLSQPLKVAGEVVGNKDYFDRPIRIDEKTAAELGIAPDSKAMQALKSLGHVAKQALPSYGRAAIDVGVGGKPLSQGVATALELPVRFGKRLNPDTKAYFEVRDKTYNSLNPNQKAEFDSVFPDKKDALGNDIKDTNPNDRITKSTILKGDDKLFKKVAEMQREIAKRTGQAIDPVYDEKYADIAKDILWVRSLAPGESSDTKQKLLYGKKIYKDFQKDERRFYDRLEKKLGKRDDPYNYPKASEKVENLERKYYSLPEGDGPRGGNKSRRIFIENNPALTKYWDKRREAQNRHRKALGLPPIEKPDFDKKKGYAKGSGSKGGGRKGGKSTVNIPSIQNFLTGNLNNAPRTRLVQAASINQRVKIPTGVPKSRIKINIAGNKRPTFGGPTRNR